MNELEWVLLEVELVGIEQQMVQVKMFVACLSNKLVKVENG